MAQYLTRLAAVMLGCVALQMAGMAVWLRYSARDWAVAGGLAIIYSAGLAVMDRNWLRKALANAQDVTMAVGLAPARVGRRALLAPVVIGAADGLLVVQRVPVSLFWIPTWTLLGFALWILLKVEQVRRWETLEQKELLFADMGGWPVRFDYLTRNR
ncbi:MAG: hypothetical protein WBZ07_05610 [Candidatus Dormiibacterota bacterium]